MINKLIWAFFGVVMTGAMVLFALAWGRYVAPGTSVDTRSALAMVMLVGSLLLFPISGILRTRRR